MSKENQVEWAAAHHVDLSADLQWHGLSPDEEAMLREDGDDEVDSRTEWQDHHRAAMQRLLLVYLFADKDAGCWENVGVRALAVMRYYLPATLNRRPQERLEGVRAAARTMTGFPLQDLVRLIAAHCEEEMVEKVMDYFFPPPKKDEVREDWLKEGCARVYLLARMYQGTLIEVEGEELTYEGMARIFDNDPLATARARNRARSRWSAKAQKLIRKPIEKAGGKARLTFGKSEAARVNYARAAMGNRNRAGGAK